MLALAALLPTACVMEPPPLNPFTGAWANPEQQKIVFRDDTVVITPTSEPATALSAASCDGKFRFGYARRSRDALLGLTSRQPDQQRRIAAQLVKQDYPVAELSCGGGGTTYVLLSERDVLAIHRDGDIGRAEHLTR